MNAIGVSGLANGSFTGSGNGSYAIYGTNTANVTGYLNASYGVFGDVTGSPVSGLSFSFGVAGVAPIGAGYSAGMGGAGNGAPIIVPINGTGGAFSSTGLALMGNATNVSNGVGVVGTGNNLSLTIAHGFVVPTTGAGVVGNGSQYGIVGYATSVQSTNPAAYINQNGSNATAGGYFEVDSAQQIQTWAYVGVRDDSFILRKIIGPGTVNTIVKDASGKLIALSCPEAPEDLFQDYGSGTLVNGRAHITIDPRLSGNIIVNADHPLRVFIQPEGDCHGVYVSHKTQTGFDVIELDHGMSNAPFSWMLTANRADEVLPGGSVSRYSHERFPPAPGPVPHETKQVQQVPAPKRAGAPDEGK
jgi:hypothetical protein